MRLLHNTVWPGHVFRLGWAGLAIGKIRNLVDEMVH